MGPKSRRAGARSCRGQGGVGSGRQRSGGVGVGSWSGRGRNRNRGFERRIGSFEQTRHNSKEFKTNSNEFLAIPTNSCRFERIQNKFERIQYNLDEFNSIRTNSTRFERIRKDFKANQFISCFFKFFVIFNVFCRYICCFVY